MQDLLQTYAGPGDISMLSFIMQKLPEERI